MPEPQGWQPSPALIVHEVPAHQAWHTQDRLAANRPVTGPAGPLRADADAGDDDDDGDGGGNGDCEDDNDSRMPTLQLIAHGSTSGGQVTWRN